MLHDTRRNFCVNDFACHKKPRSQCLLRKHLPRHGVASLALHEDDYGGKGFLHER
jgi:hypothetical protein